MSDFGEYAMTDVHHRRVADADLAELLRAYEEARQNKAGWSKIESQLKRQILHVLGYVYGDPKPAPLAVTDQSGTELGEVKVSFRKGLDIPYLKERYPDVYAECEKQSPAISLKGTET